MRKLFWRIFLSFWVAMTLIVGGVAATVYWIVSDARANPPQFETELFVREAERALSVGGTKELKSLLERRSRDGVKPAIYAFDSSRQELLGRRLPPPEFHRSIGLAARPGRPGELHRRIFTVIGPDDEQYWFVVAPDISRLGRWFFPIGPARVHWPALVIAIVVTVATCLLLARYLSAPIDKLRLATSEVAAGNLGVRVGPSLGARGDELGLLAADFDHMSKRLRVLLDGRKQLMRDLSHELRSPLARLHVALGLARRPGAAVEPQLDRIELEAGRIDALVGQILLLSQLNDPSAAVERESVDVVELLDSLVQDSNIEAAARKIVVTGHKDGGDAILVYGDRRLLGSAIENVLRNAIYHSPDGGVIDVELQGTYGETRISVMDRGAGVPADELESIFKPFYSAGGKGPRVTGGHGLGLAITRRIMTLHYGSVQARNRDGGGLTMELRLPQRV